MVMAFYVTSKTLIINQLNKSCSRCTRFVYPSCNAVYILFTAIISKLIYQCSHLTNVSKHKPATTN